MAAAGLPPKKHLRTRMFAVAVAATILATGAIAVDQREKVAEAFPVATRLYSAAGLPVNADRLIISDLRGRMVHDGSERFLAVEGNIANPYRTTLPVPKLALAVRNLEGRAIYQWTADAGVAKLKPGETAAFRARLSAPPLSGRDVSAKFAGVGG